MLQRPFVPRSKANQLSAFMVARNDPRPLREARALPDADRLVAPSPSRAASLIEADPRHQPDSSRCSTNGDRVSSAAPTQLVPDRQYDLLRAADLRGGQGRGIVPPLELRRGHLWREGGARLDERRRRGEASPGGHDTRPTTAPRRTADHHADDDADDADHAADDARQPAAEQRDRRAADRPRSSSSATERSARRSPTEDFAAYGRGRRGGAADHRPLERLAGAVGEHVDLLASAHDLDHPPPTTTTDAQV